MQEIVDDIDDEDMQAEGQAIVDGLVTPEGVLYLQVIMEELEFEYIEDDIDDPTLEDLTDDILGDIYELLNEIFNRTGWVGECILYINRTYNMWTAMKDALIPAVEISIYLGPILGWYNKTVTFHAGVLRNLYRSLKEWVTAPTPLRFLRLLKSVKQLFANAFVLYKFIQTEGWEEVIEVERQLIEALFNETEDFINWLGEEPWKDPILIRGSVTNYVGEVTITCDGEETIVEDDYYEVYYQTENEWPTWWIHQCQVTAEDDEQAISKSPRAFSGGNATIDFDFSEDDDNSVHVEQSNPAVQGEAMSGTIFNRV